MNFRTLVGAVSLSALAGFAVLAGGLQAQTASAAAPFGLAQTAQTAQTTATPAPATPQPGTPGAKGDTGFGFGGRGGHHGGFGGFDGRGGFGRGGGQYTADGAYRVISGTTQLITLVKSDLTYATGKMNTDTVQDWLTRADNLLKTAQTAVGSSQYGRAVETAQAAGDLARAADTLMAQALGANTLPSYNQRPLRGKGGVPGTGTGTTATVTQAQASRALSGFYNAILASDALLKSASNAGDAGTYLTAAKNSYSTAHAAYQAGKYNEAVSSTAVGKTLLSVVNHLLRAATAPAGTDTPVQVPPPNF
jgi:hypothetical protein